LAVCAAVLSSMTLASGSGASRSGAAAPSAAAPSAVAPGVEARGAEAPGPFYVNSFAKNPSAAELAAVGRLLFFDRALSASGKVACASCHDPKYAFGPPNEMSVQRAGGDGRRFGARAVPSLMYAQNVPPFTEHFVDDDGDDSVDQGPAGGRTWDGRALSAHDQARLPLFSEFEMANADPDSVVEKIEHGAYAAAFRRNFGDNIFDDSTLAFKAVLLALEAYQQVPQEFYPYSSKYDAWLRGRTTLSEQEARGLAAFNDPAKGNCARCHPSGRRGGAFPQFTDFGYAAIGVPRNRAIPLNAAPNYFDLGLCGPWRSDLTTRSEYCGMFRTPTLRNVALRRVFFHNGIFHRLDDAVKFYARRDTQPQRWYPSTTSGVRKFDDLPARYRANVDAQPPFDRRRGEIAALSDADVADIVVFLHALSDGYEITAR
jgi:cytochrome c peroxidase